MGFMEQVLRVSDPKPPLALSGLQRNVKVQEIYLYPENLTKELARFDKLCFGSEGMTEKEWAQVIQRNTIVVCAWDEATTQGKQLTYVGMAVAKYAGSIGYLYSSAVLETYRNLGIGRRMVEKRISALHGCGCSKIQAHTKIDNKASQGMLSKCGFKAVQYIPDFYDDFVDAILWERVY